MNKWQLFWLFVATDTRSLLRERGQVISLVVYLGIVLSLSVMVGIDASREQREAQDQSTPSAPVEADHDADTYKAPSATNHRGAVLPAEVSKAVVATIRWTLILTTAAIAFWIAILFGTQTLAVFAGERDARTMELLLAAPIPDQWLFILKVAAVIIPAVLVSYVAMLATGLAAAWLLPLEHMVLPAGTIVEGILLSLPIPIAVTGLIIGLGIIASTWGESLKGAGQLFAFILMVILMGPVLAALMAEYLELGPQLATIGKWWLSLKFATQYAAVLGLPLAMGLLTLLLAYARFDRERLLT